jgi:hypothetical protein
MCISEFQGMVNPEKTIDETVVPFTGQLLMKQYIAIKQIWHKGVRTLYCQGLHMGF